MMLLFLLILCLFNNKENYSFLIKKTYSSSYSSSSLSQPPLSSTSSNDDIIDHQFGIIGLINKFRKPQHIGVPRSKINLQFAVQLMRTSYNMVDFLDFVAMDEFQRTFFLFRQNEWEDYKGYHQNVMQGDLADPVYFDFISYAQYAVISDKIKNGKLEFVEKVNATGDTQIVRRDPMFNDNKMLSSVHSAMVGEKLLESIMDTYNNNPKLLPPPPTNNAISFDDFKQYAQLILDIFLINGYALSMELTPLPSVESGQSIYKIVTKLPINLWSLQALIVRGDTPVNNFEVKVLQALAERYKLRLELLSTTFTNKIDVNYIVRLK